MGYYLSRKNQKIVNPYLKVLEVSKQSVTFNATHPDYLRDLIRAAFNTSHKHLKELYNLRVTKTQLVCHRVDIQINLEISNIVETPAQLFQIAQAIIENNVPIKYLQADIPEEELSSLNSLAESKSLVINYTKPILEITYG